MISTLASLLRAARPDRSTGTAEEPTHETDPAPPTADALPDDHPAGSDESTPAGRADVGGDDGTADRPDGVDGGDGTGPGGRVDWGSPTADWSPRIDLFSGTPLDGGGPDRPTADRTSDAGGADDAAAADGWRFGETTAATRIAPGLAAEIEAGAVADGDLETLREALGAGPTPAVEHRLRHLESQVGRLRAYADAIEAFVDGADDTGGLAGAVDARIDEGHGELAAAIDAVRDEVAAVSAEVERQAAERRSEIERLDGRLEGAATTLTDALVALDDDVKGLRDAVEEGRAWRAEVEETLDDVRSDTRRPTAAGPEEGSDGEAREASVEAVAEPARDGDDGGDRDDAGTVVGPVDAE